MKKGLPGLREILKRRADLQTESPSLSGGPSTPTRMTHHPFRTHTLLLALSALTTSAATLLAGSAVDPAAGAASADTAWRLDLNTGFSYTSGNADTLGLSIGLDAERRWQGWQLIGKGNYDYTEADNLTTSNALRLGLQLNRDLTDRWYVGLANTFTYDELAALDYRYQPSLALGYRLWKSERGELTVEAGPGYTWERQGGVVDDYATIRFAERFRFTLSENARILQSLEYLPQIDDFGRYLLVAEAALTTRIVGNLWWRTAVRNIYNSEPPIGLKQNDLQLVTGLTWGLGDPEATATKKKVRRKSDVVKPAAAPSRPEGVWQTTAALGFSLTKGNADNLMVLGDITSNMISAPHEYSLNIGGGYGEVNSASTVNFFRAGAQYNRQLTDRFYVGATANYLTDSIADLDYRLAPYGLLGYKVINTDTVSLRFEGGPGYMWEKQGGVARDFISLLARERLEVAVSETAKVWQSFTAQFDLDDTENYLLTGDLGVDFWLTDNISVRTVATNVYDNRPAPGAEENDFRLTSGIAISF